MASTQPLVEGSWKHKEREWLRAQSAEWWQGVLDRIAGGERPSEIAREFYVRYAILIRVVEEDEGRREEFRRALEIHAHGLMFETLEIADTVQMGEVRKVKGDGSEEVTTGDMVEHRKMRISQRNKLAAVWNRMVYGEKVDVSVGVVGLDTLLAQVESARRARALPAQAVAIEGEVVTVDEAPVGAVAVPAKEDFAI